MKRAPREHVTRTVATEPGRLRRGSAIAVLALLAASALTPAAIEVAGGGAVAGALAGIAGNVGSDYLAGVLERAAARLGRGRRSAEPPESETVRDALAADLLSALEKNDTTARELSAELTALLMKVDGFQAAVTAADDDLRGHLFACFAALAEQQHAALQTLRVIEAEQRRQGKQLRHQTRLNEEMVDRLRWLSQQLADPKVNVQPGVSSAGQMQLPRIPIFIAPGSPTVPAHAGGWYGGAEVAIDEQVYLIHADFLEEHFSTDDSVLRRHARGLRLVPARGSRNGYVWIREVEMRRDTPTARVALQALGRERDLLTRLRQVPGLPAVSQFRSAGGRGALVVGWPTSRTGAPCETLGTVFPSDGPPIDPWHLFRLSRGLAGLCDTLARLHEHGITHRYLTPAGIITLDDRRLALRDLGLAARDPEPGEGPAHYQAPEQRHGGMERSRPQTDVYQLAAVAYHVITGHPPGARSPLPIRARAQDLPEGVSRAVDAALAANPLERPSLGSFAATLRAAGQELAGGA